MNRMKKLALFFLAMASFSVTEANAQTIFRISPGANCPDFTEKYKEGYCKAFVKNKFTGAYLDGSCPIGSAPVGEGYCMFNY